MTNLSLLFSPMPKLAIVRSRGPVLGGSWVIAPAWDFGNRSECNVGLENVPTNYVTISFSDCQLEGRLRELDASTSNESE